MESNQNQCSICNNSTSLQMVHEKWICKDCLNIGIENLTKSWKEALEVLLREYSDAFDRCLSTDQPELIPQARTIGFKIRAVLEFLGLPKKHDLLLAIRKINRTLNKFREANVFLDEVKNKKDENKTYAALVKVGTKKQQKQQKHILENISVFNDSFFIKMEKFLNKELAYYVLPIVKENVVSQYEESFNQLVADFHQTAKEKGPTTAETIKAIRAVQRKSTSLLNVYHFLSEIYGENFQEKETYHKDLQQQLDNINDTIAWFTQIKAYEKKIDVPKSEINNIKKNIKEGLAESILSMGPFEVQVKDIGL